MDAEGNAGIRAAGRTDALKRAVSAGVELRESRPQRTAKAGYGEGASDGSARNPLVSKRKQRMLRMEGGF